MARNLPFDEQVRVRAYEIFLSRAGAGGTGGSPEQDWLQAEEEIRRQAAAAGEPIPEDPLENAETRPGPSASADKPGRDGTASRRPARTGRSNAARRA